MPVAEVSPDSVPELEVSSVLVSWLVALGRALAGSTGVVVLVGNATPLAPVVVMGRGTLVVDASVGIINSPVVSSSVFVDETSPDSEDDSSLDSSVEVSSVSVDVSSVSVDVSIVDDSKLPLLIGEVAPWEASEVVACSFGREGAGLTGVVVL